MQSDQGWVLSLKVGQVAGGRFIALTGSGVRHPELWGHDRTITPKGPEGRTTTQVGPRDRGHQTQEIYSSGLRSNGICLARVWKHLEPNHPFPPSDFSLLEWQHLLCACPAA